MPEGDRYPAKLSKLLRRIRAAATRAERIQTLIDVSRQYREVPQRIATRPYAKDHEVPGCESRVYMYTEDRDDGTLEFHFAVENPHGVSAKALAVILADTLSGAPLAEVAALSSDIVYDLFGQDLSMGKSMGLQGMVQGVARTAQRAMEAVPGEGVGWPAAVGKFDE
jgi:cysteine desulfuration protein SufE